MNDLKSIVNDIVGTCILIINDEHEITINLKDLLINNYTDLNHELLDLSIVVNMLLDEKLSIKALMNDQRIEVTKSNSKNYCEIDLFISDLQ